MNHKQRYKAIIDDVQYTIVGTETKEHLDMVTQMVDEEFRLLKGKVSEASREQVATLLAINLMSDLLKKQAENLILKKEQVKNLGELKTANDKISSLELAAKRSEEARKITQAKYDELFAQTPAGKMNEMRLEINKSNSEAKQKILNNFE